MEVSEAREEQINTEAHTLKVTLHHFRGGNNGLCNSAHLTVPTTPFSYVDVIVTPTPHGPM